MGRRKEKVREGVKRKTAREGEGKIKVDRSERRRAESEGTDGERGVDVEEGEVVRTRTRRRGRRIKKTRVIRTFEVNVKSFHIA